MVNLPVQGYPDPNKRYIIYMDGSNDCIGVCLTQPCDDTLITRQMKRMRNQFTICHIN